MAGRVTIRRFNGVNLSVGLTELADNDLALSRNLHPVKPGGDLMLRRNSRVLMDNAGILPDGGTIALYNFWDGRRTKLIGWLQGSDSRGARLVEFLEDDAYNSFSDIQWIYDSLGNLSYVSDIGSTIKPAAVQWQNSLYLFTGGYTPGWRLDYRPADNAFSAEVLATPISNLWAPGDMPRATVAGTYRGTVMISGFEDDKSLIRWLEVGDPTVLVSAAKGIWVNRHLGDRVTGLFEVMFEGGAGALNSYAVVAKSGSMRMLTGDPPTSATDGTLDASVVISDTEGCISKETIAKTPYGMIWCSGANVWLAPTNGAKPVPIGTAIASMLEQRAQNPDLWCGVFHQGFYRLSVPTAGGDQSSPSSTIINPSLTQTEQWWCDLRVFPKLSWWGPMEMQTDTMVSQKQADGSQRLLSAVVKHGDPAIVGDSKFYLEEMEVSTPDRYDHYAALDLNWALPDGEVRLKEFDFEDPGVNKIIEAVEVTYHNAVPFLVQVDLIKNSGSDTASQIEYGLYHDGFNLDFSLLDSDDPRDKLTNFSFRTRTFNPPKGQRFLAQTIQPVVKLMPDPNAVGSGDMRLRSIVLRARVIPRRPSGRDPSTDYGDGSLGGGIDTQ